MKQSETCSETTNLPTVSSEPIARNISVCEAKTFWQHQCAEGKVDLLFEQLQSKLQLLWQKIKEGSATNQDYLRALLLVNVADLEVNEIKPDPTDKQQEDKDCLPLRKEEVSAYVNPEIENEASSPEAELSDPIPSIVSNIGFVNHDCGRACLSSVNPYFSNKGNALKFPIMCHFQRWHGKSCLLSRPLDVIYKAPCGKSLRSFDDVRSYLFQTHCSFLFVDHFSFNTYLQLDRNITKSQSITQAADISADMEPVPVSFCNEIDHTQLCPFTYRKTPWPPGYSIYNFTNLFTGCCSCTDGCLDVSVCECLQLTARAHNKISARHTAAPGYVYKRLQAPIPTGLYECNVSCTCDRKMCQNRVVQHGLQVRLQVYKTKGKGWGVRCLDDLDKGTFVCIYAGRVFVKAKDINPGQDCEAHVIQTDRNKTISISPKRKRRVSHSDSEITILPSLSTTKHTITDSSSSSGSSQTETTRMKGFFRSEKLNLKPIIRPKTKTAFLQKRRRQLMEKGAVTVQHSSEDDDVDELPIPPASPRLLCFSVPDDTQDGKTGIRTDAIEEKALLSVNSQSDESNSSIQLGFIPLQQSNLQTNSDCPDPNSEEIICFLDASKEGNVARFLNASTELKRA